VGGCCVEDIASSKGNVKPESKSNAPKANSFYRCAGPNCGLIKNASDRWWLMWASAAEPGRTVLSLCRWDEAVALREGAFPVCGEQCAQRLQSQFMGNIMQSELRRSRTKSQ
jgi:hypothetical protein